MKQSEKTRTIILDAANQLFYQQGYKATSISHIEKKTGLSKGNITYHFKSKNDILHAVIAKRLAHINSMLNSWDNDFPTAQGRLLRFVDMLVNENLNLQQYGCPMGTLTSEFAKGETQLYEMTLPMFCRFRKWLGKQFEQLGNATDTADELAVELLARAQGISMLTHVFKDISILDRETNKLKQELMTLNSRC